MNKNRVTALIEIPMGSRVKWEFDPQTQSLAVDRVLPPETVYPANYGSLLGTRADDGDPLDVIVLTREPLATGAELQIEPIAVLEMRDGGVSDAKIIGVPAGANAEEKVDLSDERRARIESFFRTYKSHEVEVLRWAGPQVARRWIADAARNCARHAQLRRSDVAPEGAGGGAVSTKKNAHRTFGLTADFADGHG